VTLRKKPRRLSTSWPGAIAGLGGLDALVNNADFQWPLPRIGWIPPISTASSRSTSAAPCCAGPVSHPDSCGGSRRLAPGPEVQPGRTAFPFTRSRGTDDAQLYLYHCGGQTADPIGFARVASAPTGALCVSCLCANMTCTMRSHPITRQAIFCTGRDDVFVYGQFCTSARNAYHASQLATDPEGPRFRTVSREGKLTANPPHA
jgi:hypothetical protein